MDLAVGDAFMALNATLLLRISGSKVIDFSDLLPMASQLLRDLSAIGYRDLGVLVMDRMYVVTSAASGIGAATARYLREREHPVIGCDLRNADVIADLTTVQGRAEPVNGMTRLSGGQIDAIAAVAGGDMILGSLRHQLVYPRAAEKNDKQLNDALKTVNLSELPERFGGLDAEMHWADVLSPGEQQRLAFARLLLNHPRYAFLDEATSALDVPNEQWMYQLLSREGIPFLSSGHRPTLLKFHRNILRFSPDHRWKVEPSSEYQPLASAA
jgi:ABC transporter